MIYLSLQLLPWLAAIFLVGAATALWARVETPRTKIAPWLVWCALAFCVAAALAALHAAQGRAGVWLETALAGFAIYVAGTAAGASRRKNGFAEHDKWALGLVPAALIWFAANLISGPSIEADLAKAVRAKINSAHARAEFSVEGRDVRISADAPNRDALVDAINEVAGVRLVATANSSASAVSDSGDTAALDAKEAPAQKAPNEAGRMADAAVETLAHAQADQTGGPTPKAEEELRPAPRARAKDRAKAAAAELKAVPRSGELDVATCQNALNNTLVIDKIQFRIGSASILRASAYVLDRLAAFLRRCPTAKVEIGGHTDNIGDGEDNQALSQRRAEAVLRYLNGEGVAAARMTAIGYGAKKPIAPNDDDEGRAENRRIEMLLK